MQKRIIISDKDFKEGIRRFKDDVSAVQGQYREFFKKDDELFEMMEVKQKPLHLDPRKLVLNHNIPNMEKLEMMKKCQESFRRHMFSKVLGQ
jgi:hypothetical protein